MFNSAVKPATCRQVAYRAIKDAIIRGEFRSEEQLETSGLAEGLKMSRTPVREALAMLSAEGLIEWRSHSRPVVSVLSTEDVCQVYEVRGVVEPHAAQAAAVVLTHRKELRQRAEELLSSARNLVSDQTAAGDCDGRSGVVGIDLALYDLLVDATRNSMLAEVLVLLKERSLRVRTYVEMCGHDVGGPTMQAITLEHIGILEALASGDGELAASATSHHLKQACQRTVAILRAGEDASRRL